MRLAPLLSAGDRLLGAAAVAVGQWRRGFVLLVGRADIDCPARRRRCNALGKFTFFARLGSTSAPIVAGAVWDFEGAWLACLVGSAWGAILT